MTWRSCPLVPIQTGLISLFKGEEKPLHYVALVAMVSGSQETVVLQIWQKIWHVWLSCAWLHSGHTFLPPFNHTNGCLRQERLLWSRNFVTMVTRRHTSLCRDGLRGLNPATWDLRSYKTLSGGSVKKIFSWNKIMCDYLLTFLVFWYSCYYLKCCQGFEDGNVAFQSYVITKFYQFFPTTNLKVQKKLQMNNREIRK